MPNHDEEQKATPAPSSPTPETASKSPATPSHERKAQKQFIDILRAVRDVHRKLSEFYAQHKYKADDPKVRLALDYMSEHEQYVTECIEAFERDAEDVVLQSWFKYSPNIEPQEWLDQVEFRPEMSADDVAELVASLDEKLLQVYRELSEQAVPEQLQEAVQNLLELEKREEIRAARSTELGP